MIEGQFEPWLGCIRPPPTPRPPGNGLVSRVVPGVNMGAPGWGLNGFGNACEPVFVGDPGITTPKGGSDGTGGVGAV